MSPTKIKASVIKPVKIQPQPMQNPLLTQSLKVAKALSQLRLPHAVSVLKKAFPHPVPLKKNTDNYRDGYSTITYIFRGSK